LCYADLIEKMLCANPKERITLDEIMKHPWVNGDIISKDEYKKEMNVRVKKIMVKIRKEQET
jgi:serine/threonine protein kinase